MIFKPLFIVYVLYLVCCCVYSQSQLIGHMLPLGYQHPPSVKIDEYTPETAPSPKEFFEKYIKSSKPAIFRNAMLQSKAFKAWTDEYLRSNYGDLELRIEGKKEKVHKIPVGEKYLGRDTIKHFVENYHSLNSSTYVVSELPKQMYKDVGVLPSLGACGDMVNSFVEIDLWWSGGDSKSVIHKDAFNQVNCLMRGTKYWKLFDNKFEKWLYKHWEDESETGGFSDINIDAVNLKKHPNFLKVPWSNLTINAGDCLFLPKSYYHQVNSDGPSNLAVSILFSRFDLVTPSNFSDCTSETEYVIPRALSDFNVMWQWKGQGVMSMGYGDFEENYRLPLLSQVRMLKNQGKSFDVNYLSDMFDAVFVDGQTENNYTGGIDCLDTNKDGVISENEVKDATFEQLRTFGEMVEFYEPSNTYTLEYSFISYPLLLTFIQDQLKLNKKLERKKWIRLYQDELGGSKDFANEVFSKLSRSDDAVLIRSKDITHEDIERALTKWKYYTSLTNQFDNKRLGDVEPDNDKNDQVQNSDTMQDDKDEL